MKTTNCAVLTPDVLIDTAKLLQANWIATPAEFHAINSLVEAVVFHDKIFFELDDKMMRNVDSARRGYQP